MFAQLFLDLTDFAMLLPCLFQKIGVRADAGWPKIELTNPEVAVLANLAPSGVKFLFLKCP